MLLMALYRNLVLLKPLMTGIIAIAILMYFLFSFGQPTQVIAWHYRSTSLLEYYSEKNLCHFIIAIRIRKSQ